MDLSLHRWLSEAPSQDWLGSWILLCGVGTVGG